MNGGISFQLISYGVVQTRTDYKVGNTSPSVIMIPLDSNYTSQLIAVRSVGFLTAKFGTQDVNGTRYAMYSCSTTSTGQNVEYWIFDLAKNLNGGSYGLRMRDPTTGDVIYNSNFDSLQIAAVTPVNVSIDNKTTSMAYTYGRKFATILPGISGYNTTTNALYVDGQPMVRDNTEDPSGYHRYQRRNDGKLFGSRWDNETVYIGPVSFDDVIAEAPGYANQPDPVRLWWSNPLTNIIVVDVTNL